MKNLRIRRILTSSVVIVVLMCLHTATFAQNIPFAQKVFILINQARENPVAFLEKNKTKIKKWSPRYYEMLQTATPMELAIWDIGLESMARSVVETGNLRPQYQGNNKVCGRTSGNSIGKLPVDPLQYVCEFFTNVHDQDYKYIGLYFNNQRNGYAFYWGKSCVTEKRKFIDTEKMDTTAVHVELLNTGKDVTYMNEAEKAMLREINFVRAYPKVYAQFVSAFLANESSRTGGLTNSMHIAGVELIEELKKMDSLSILQPNLCVYEAARLHGMDCQVRGFPDHVGSDKSMPWDRIKKHCELVGNENLVGNPAVHPRIPVIYLLLDPGISDRGHRYNMLNKDWKYAGVYKYDYPMTRFYWVQNFAY